MKTEKLSKCTYFCFPKCNKQIILLILKGMLNHGFLKNGSERNLVCIDECYFIKIKDIKIHLYIYIKLKIKKH